MTDPLVANAQDVDSLLQGIQGWAAWEALILSAALTLHQDLIPGNFPIIAHDVTAGNLSITATVEEINPLLVDPDAEELLKGHFVLVHDLARLLGREARKHDVKDRPIWVTRFVDPQDGSRELVVTQHVALDAPRALQYWDLVGEAIGAWAAQRSEADRQALISAVAVDIDWRAV